MSVIKRVNELYNAGDVKRLHTVNTLQTQTVGQHVYGSQIIAVELLNRAIEEGIEVRAVAVLIALLLHDAPEVVTGDIPAPTKRAMPGLNAELDKMEFDFYEKLNIEVPELTKAEADIVKSADVLDLMMTCVRERRLGNRHPRLAEVMRNVATYLNEQIHVAGVVELRAELWEAWVEA